MADETTQTPATEDRLNSLLAKSEAASAQAESTAAANALLTQRLAQLETRLASIASPRPQESSPKATTSTQGSNGADIAALVEGIVTKAIAPVVKKLEDSEAKSARDAKQAPAWAQAVRENPELNDANSNLRRVAEKIWAQRPDIQALDDAPLIVANLARSVLTEARTAETKKTDVKRQAGITKPAPVTQRTQFTETEQDQEIRAVHEDAEAGITAGAGPKTYTNMFRAALTQALRQNQ